MNIIYTSSDVVAPSTAVDVKVERHNGSTSVEVTFATKQEALNYSRSLDVESECWWVDLSTDVEAEGWSVGYDVYDEDCIQEPDYDAEFEQCMESRMSCYGY